MKVAIAATGKSINAFISKTFARCQYFALYDISDKKIVFISNQFREKTENAGEEAALYLIKMGAQRLVAGEFGAKMQKITNKFEIPLIIPGKENLSIKKLLNLINSNNTNQSTNENSNSNT